MEALIDGLDSQLPPLTAFILPSGGRASSALHYARTICRRAERSIYPAVEVEVASESAVAFMNRVSDLLFAAARFAGEWGGGGGGGGGGVGHTRAVLDNVHRTQLNRRLCSNACSQTISVVL